MNISQALELSYACYSSSFALDFGAADLLTFFFAFFFAFSRTQPAAFIRSSNSFFVYCPGSIIPSSNKRKYFPLCALSPRCTEGVTLPSTLLNLVAFNAPVVSKIDIERAHVFPQKKMGWDFFHPQGPILLQESSDLVERCDDLL